MWNRALLKSAYRILILPSLLSALAFSTSDAIARVGNDFPSIEAEQVSGTVVHIPVDYAGKYTLIGLGTSNRSEEELRTWQVPVYNKFVAKTGLMDGMYDVNICFIPLFTGAAKMAKNKVVKKLEENNESLVMEHVYIYSGSRDPFREVGLGDKSEPEIVLINPSGKIVWITTGKFERDKLDEVESILSE